MISSLYDQFKYWNKTGTLWIYSDPHFGESDLEAGMANRPSSEQQVANINRKVGKTDTLIILGDVGDTTYVKQLRAGYKILVMGNHDKGKTNYERKKFHVIYSSPDGSDDALWAREQVAKEYSKYNITGFKMKESFIDGKTRFHFDIDNKLFDEVYEGPVMIAEKLILSHEPVNVPWAVNFHGHDHTGKFHSDKLHYNFCADTIGYEPVNLNSLMKKGPLSAAESIHRTTINAATARSMKRGRGSLLKLL